MLCTEISSQKTCSLVQKQTNSKFVILGSLATSEAKVKIEFNLATRARIIIMMITPAVKVLN